jgi:hypothetical protein
LAEPITDYQTFRSYRVPIADIRRLCARLNLSRPVKASRITRGEVSALFLLDFGDAPSLILKIFVRPPGLTQMITGAEIDRQIKKLTSVPTQSGCIPPRQMT